MARPSSYTPELGNEIARLHAEGLTLTNIAHGLGFSLSAFYDWRRTYPDFDRKMDDARLMFGQACHDQMFDIAKNERHPGRAKVAIQMLQWAAARNNPTAYGDRIDIKIEERIDIQGVLDQIEKRLHGPVIDVTPEAKRPRRITAAQIKEEDIFT